MSCEEKTGTPPISLETLEEQLRRACDAAAALKHIASDLATNHDEAPVSGLQYAAEAVQKEIWSAHDMAERLWIGSS